MRPFNGHLLVGFSGKSVIFGVRDGAGSIIPVRVAGIYMAHLAKIYQFLVKNSR
jgi:hypothetical protein